MNSDKLIAVAGATGQQGGATTRHLLERGFRVRALTRDPGSDSAKQLQALGAETAAADLADPATLGPALEGAHGVFSVQNFWLPDVGYEGEIAQGKNLADAAKAAGVKHFVYTSVGGAERESGVPHFDSKWIIEQYIASLGLPATILRPVAFMENNLYQRDAILAGTFPTGGIAPGKTLQIVAVDDIGAFAAIAFAKPEEFIGQAIELAGDDLTEEQMAEAFSRVTGRTVTLNRTPPEGAPEPDAEMVKMITWFNEHGYKADIPALRKTYPGLKTLETWAREAGFDAAIATA
jgi:uncharacterized protein YbjT (DUF2867 family)